jgi:hypothetical protein
MDVGFSPAIIGLVIRERSKGKSLRELGQMFGTSHEAIRQLLAKYGPPKVTMLPEKRVAANLGYPSRWLAKLRKEGIIHPIKPAGFWLYSEEQVRQIPALIAEVRKCEQCGKPRPPGSVRFCSECHQNRKKNHYQFLSPEAKERHRESCRMWRKVNRKKKTSTNKKWGTVMM